MTTTVYVWMPNEEVVGHASVGINGNAGSRHISWWPKAEQKATTSSQLKSAYWGVDAVRFSLADDEGPNGENKLADHAVLLDGLAEAKMIAWWDALDYRHWSLFNTNCAQVVAEVLRAGDANKYLHGWDYWWGSWNVVWRPKRVLEFAQAIKMGLASRRGN